MAFYVSMNSDATEGVIHQDFPPRVVGRIYNVAPITGHFELFIRPGDLEEPFVNPDGSMVVTVRSTTSAKFYPEWYVPQDDEAEEAEEATADPPRRRGRASTSPVSSEGEESQDV